MTSLKYVLALGPDDTGLVIRRNTADEMVRATIGRSVNLSNNVACGTEAMASYMYV
jgi:hypothetical protein